MQRLSPPEIWILSVESGFDPHAHNPQSTAFGVGQLILVNRELYAKKLGCSSDTVDFEEQVAMFRNYVLDRYHTAAHAKVFHLAHGWY
jgi:hypothetical protein